MPRLPCVIVLDLSMPMMDGHGFLKLRASDPLLSDIPVVVSSSNMQSEAPLKESMLISASP